MQSYIMNEHDKHQTEPSLCLFFEFLFIFSFGNWDDELFVA